MASFWSYFAQFPLYSTSANPTLANSTSSNCPKPNFPKLKLTCTTTHTTTQGDRELVFVHRTRRDRVSVAFLIQALVGHLIVCLKRHVTEDREGARWLLSRPDRALRCLHGQVMFMESVQTPFTVSLLWHFRWDVGFARVSPTVVHIIVLIVEFDMIARDPEWQHIPMGLTIDVSDERLVRLI